MKTATRSKIPNVTSRHNCFKLRPHLTMIGYKAVSSSRKISARQLETQDRNQTCLRLKSTWVCSLTWRNNRLKSMKKLRNKNQKLLKSNLKRQLILPSLWPNPRKVWSLYRIHKDQLEAYIARVCNHMGHCMWIHKGKVWKLKRVNKLQLHLFWRKAEEHWSLLLSRLQPELSRRSLS
jgi:hypothetical protein